jgi:uncharacterized protein YkwD
MKQTVGIILFIILVAGLGLFFFSDKIETRFGRIFSDLAQPKTTGIQSVVDRIAEEIFTPIPLKKLTEEPLGSLDAKSVIRETNKERASGGLPLLTENTRLDNSAQKKLGDMIAKNYFAHVSPEGKGPAVWVKDAEYQYIMVGENLAMGNFSDEKDLVNAWMESPGHRANIMNQKFSEIGVAVKRGTIEGSTAIIAVQVFGMPASICPPVKILLKESINSGDKRLKEMNIQISELRSTINSTKKNNNAEEYNRLIDEYNGLISQYNALLEETKSVVEEYNASVRAYNTCAVKP